MKEMQREKNTSKQGEIMFFIIFFLFNFIIFNLVKYKQATFFKKNFSTLALNKLESCLW